MTRGAIILCGGKSTRMSHDKATLEFAGSTMLARVLIAVAQVVESSRTVVVAAEGQTDLILPADVILTHDANPNRGPLEGLAAGFRAIPPGTDAVFVCSCDVPFLAAAVIERLFTEIKNAKVDGVIPFDRDDDRHHYLTAVYRTTCSDRVEQQLATNQLSLHRFCQRLNVREITTSAFLDVDPTLGSFCNINTPADLDAALRTRGLESR